jgi:alpha-amylase
MKRIYFLFTVLTFFLASGKAASGWPAKYHGVMLQGFYWDSYDATKWTNLESQADELGEFFSLVWLPQSAKAVNNPSMGYDGLYWLTNYNSSFGNEQELRSLISAFKKAGIGTIADVVINHRGNVSTWTDFPAEVYKGETYQLVSTDIVANDDGGRTKAWADSHGISLSSNYDTGDGWDGMRDLDHYSPNVQKNVKAYLGMLLNDLGYIGFRYDMVKGYAGSFTGIYNSAAKPAFSVGEYWDGNPDAVKNWINATKVEGVPQSAAFDFPLRYTIRNAANDNNWGILRNGAGLAKDGYYQQYAVTFVENHDTEKRSGGPDNDPVRRDTLAANAYMLAMPGTPCIFLKHWMDCKKDLKQMISARRLVGIHSQSAFTSFASGAGYYAVKTAGDSGELLTVVGTAANSYKPSAGWTELQSGYHYRHFVNSAVQTAWTDLPSGTYDGEQTVKLKAVSTQTIRLVYTTDGTEPTASSTQVTSGTTIALPLGKVTLKVGLLVGGSVTGVITRNYNSVAFTPHDITVCVNADNVGWSTVNFWSWGGDGTHAPANASWPGDKVTSTKTVNGKKWLYKTYRLNTSSDAVSFVFSTGTGSPQTVDVEGVNRNSYFEISAEKAGDKHLVNDVTDVVDGISAPEASANTDVAEVYSPDGRLVKVSASEKGAAEGLPKGIYIMNNRKFVVK